MASYRTGSLSHRGKSYDFRYYDIDHLKSWSKNNKKLVKELEFIYGKQRNKTLKINDLIQEAENKKIYYHFIYNNSNIITVCKIHIDKYELSADISGVHTSEKYRNMGFCYKNLCHLIAIIVQYFKNMKCLTIGVDINNNAAIKCYEKVGFKIQETKKDKFGKYHNMNLKF